MWFNDTLASDRWIDEGFASFYAEQAVLQLGLPDHAPALSASLMPAAIPLNDWTSAGTPGTATEAYLYGASLEAARSIVAIAGLDGMRQVWTQARAGTAAYAGSPDPRPEAPLTAQSPRLPGADDRAVLHGDLAAVGRDPVPGRAAR